MTSTVRIIGLDFGEKRIGVAISDPLKITAQPLKTITYSNEHELWEQLDQLWQTHEIKAVVVGLPVNMNGSMGASSQKAKLFAQKIKERYMVELYFWDERLSSYTAKKTMQEMGEKTGQQKEKVDKLAAALILQGYLDKQRESVL